MTDVPVWRLYVMRLLYLMTFVGVGMMAFPALINPPAPIAPMRGVALAFWGALSIGMAFGLRYPLKMLPLILLQLMYKLIWLAAVALPAWRAGAMDQDMGEFINGMMIGAMLDIIAIPWVYTFQRYVREPGEKWTNSALATASMRAE